MKLLIDSACTTEIYKLVPYITGVTTNPRSIIDQINKSSLQELEFRNLNIEESLWLKYLDMIDNLMKTCAQYNLLLHVQPKNYNNIEKESNDIISLAKKNDFLDSLVIKLPAIHSGFLMCKHLAKQNIKTNITVCFSVDQAILASNVQASYISFFIGRGIENNINMENTLLETRNIYNFYKANTRILAASIRTIDHFNCAIKNYSDYATLRYDLYQHMIDNKITSNQL